MTLPNSDNGSSLGVDDVFGHNWNANFHVMQLLSDDFDFFSPQIGYQNFKHLKFHGFSSKNIVFFDEKPMEFEVFEILISNLR